MKVTVHVPSSHKTVVVNVGKGGQTVRWLATVAAQRARMTNQPHGSRRTREANLKFIGRFLPEQLVVTVRAPGTRTGASLVGMAAAHCPRCFSMPRNTGYQPHA